MRGYHAPTWITFRQAGFLMDMGRKAARFVEGGRGTTVVYSSALTRTDVDPETGEDAETRPALRRSGLRP
ncbi:ArdC-like ssDNA-binding domain-containing protein [Tistrella mobilis]|uniref:ArdC-like ssDNA-binding domain-containing protein n=1 Tax=Tistrella mobilis TaxID=171437 RepID=UPI003555E0B4